MKLPIVDVFENPYESWKYRNASNEEILEFYRTNGYFKPQVKDKLIATINNHLDAAIHMAKIGADNGLENYIDRYLDDSANYKALRNAMPSKTPKVLFDYQQKFPNYSAIEVDKEINNIGHTLSEGQYLFHGGAWLNGTLNQFKTIAPLSTSFCPQVALRNAEWRGKAYDNNKIELFVLRVKDPITNVFAFPRKNASMGNEKEVLFASGATLYRKNTHLIRNDYPAAKYEYPDKQIPIYVVEIDIS
ncbi:TPA: hypothetical protein MM329_000701 [Escherichia coli]|nr:hypothetical protein [Escherichia coli]HBZ8229067.1 hypothetical protein [Escherichia coli]HBZ8345795.1 hypothetical protein [Escherichia coli]HBZ8350864.1 hypothetical protein [Escherichia coli]HBZ8356196.1 hypothetical protein [Escherichia coli]